MGCDYYHIELLRVYSDETQFVDIVIRIQPDYFMHNCFDVDEADAYVRDALTPKTKPIVIYENHEFTNPVFKKKFKPFLKTNLHKMKMKWNDIQKIVKMEDIRERG